MTEALSSEAKIVASAKEGAAAVSGAVGLEGSETVGESATGGAGGSTKRLDLLQHVASEVQKIWAVERRDECAVDESRPPYHISFPFPYMNGRLHLGHGLSLSKAEFTARFKRLQGFNVMWPLAFHCTGMPIRACADKLRYELEALALAAKTQKSSPNSVAGDADVDVEAEAEAEAEAEGEGEKEITTGVFKSKKSKAAAKTGGMKLQSDILRSFGIGEDLIPKFVDPNFWVDYFPAKCQEDCTNFGASCDWRRSFITTDRNPYFDAFIKWQFRLLRARDKIRFGLRPTVYSRLDNQPNADHDRSAGEGAVPQEYTLVKMKVLDSHVPQSWRDAIATAHAGGVGRADESSQDTATNASSMANASGVGSASSVGSATSTINFYLVAATLRPETMYGQTNCFVLPDGEYGIYPALDERCVAGDNDIVARTVLKRDEVVAHCHSFYVCAPRSAANMSCQGIIPMDYNRPIHGGAQSGGALTSSDDDKRMYEPVEVTRVSGQSLIGLPLKAPLCVYDEIYVLPLPSIRMDKGTGVVTSVPSDAPDDYAMLRDLQQKEVIRKAYNVKPEWCDREVVEIIEIPGFGRKAAVDLCEQRKVAGWRDAEKLKEIKAEVYLKGFYEGRFLVGEYKGELVQDAKGKIKAELLRENLALTYYEPDKKVVSRSNDECVVAMCNQWYSDFGNAQWKELVLSHVSNPGSFDAHGQRAAYEQTVNWLQGWACSRTYGLGTLLPWEAEKGNKVLIESLSDSTIYMAYYTIAHFLQGNVDGSLPGLLDIKPEQLTDHVFDYIFCQSPPSSPTSSPTSSTQATPSASALESKISLESLQTLRKSFEYFYPVSLRCSGKDLLPNHMTMALFHHAAVWPTQPHFWPRGFYVNGHMLLDNDKMSKSTGNFLSLTDSIGLFSADATRVALADAGDAVDDANFERATATAAIMRLYLLLQFVDEVCAEREGATPLRRSEKSAVDAWIANEIVDKTQRAKEAYEAMSMRDALKYSFYEFLAIRDLYRNLLGPTVAFHHDVIFDWIRTIALILSPIAPHTCEYIHSTLQRALLKASGNTEPETKVSASNDPQVSEKQTEKPRLIADERWPHSEDTVCVVKSQELAFLLAFVESARKSLEKAFSGKKKAPTAAPPAISSMNVFIANEYPEDRKMVFSLLQKVEMEATATGVKPADPKWIDAIRRAPEILALDKRSVGVLMGFASFQMKLAETQGHSALEAELPFEQKPLLASNSDFILRSLHLEAAKLELKDACEAPPGVTPLPGLPHIIFSNN